MIIFSQGDAGLPTKERKSSVTSLNLENFKLVFRGRPKFCFGPTCLGALGFSFQADLPASRAGWRLNH